MDTGRTPRPEDAKTPERDGDAESGIELGMLADLLGFNLRCAQLAVFRHFAGTVGQADITAPQFGTLLLIEANPGVSQSAVAEALRFDRSTLVQIIDRLEQRGLVVRGPSDRDRRSHALHLTKEGADLLGRLKTTALAHEDAVAAKLDGKERARLVELLQKLYMERG